MDPLTYRITARQRRGLRCAVLLMSIVAISLTITTGVSGRWVGSSPGLTIGIGGAALAGLWALLVYARAYTECTPTRIRTRWLAGTHECRWEDVAAIEARSRRGSVTVLIATKHGSRFSLGAPIEAGVMGDPQFTAKLAEIQQYWHAAVAVASRSDPA